MKPILSSIALAAALAAAGPAGATLVTHSATGSVGDYWFQTAIVSDDFALGTAMGWSFTFDDSFVGIPATDLVHQLGLTQAVSGSFTLGTQSYTLSQMKLTSFSFNATTANGIDHYGWWIQGTGPDTPDGEPFSGLWLYYSADMKTPWDGASASFGNVNGMVADNGYLAFSGTQSLVPAPATVPEPATAWLALPALALAGLGRRRRQA